jgi:ubiquinone/menaquinone biosynthesis C-methylase UbiE
MTNSKYLMENADEARRLELKTDIEKVTAQVLWAGLQPGMRVADLGCGPGKITELLHQLVGPDGEAVGIDNSIQRIAHAERHYGNSGARFFYLDLLEPMDDLGRFDFIYIRFVLEYFRSQATSIVRNVTRLLNPDGILCLVDLDYSCTSQFGMPSRLAEASAAVLAKLREEADFDPRVGARLYSMLYDLGFRSLNVNVETNHLIFGELDSVQKFDWTKRVEVVFKNSGYDFEEYEDGYDGFFAEFRASFADPRRFFYMPLICCRGVRPAEQ